MEIKENKECIKDQHQTDPRDDKTRIQRTKGELLRDSYRWILEHADFKQWCGNPEYGLLWIKGDPGKGKTMLLCGIIDEIEKSTLPPCLSYFFCQATEPRLSSATAVLRGLIYMIIIQRPLLISHVRERYDHSGKKLFDDSNAWEALSGILKAILNDPALNDAIMIVDALDECVEGLPMLLQFVSEASCSYRAKWIVSSRNWPAIEESLHTTMQSVRLCLELNEMSVSAAVQTYIRHKVQELADKKRYDDITKDAVEQHLVINAHGTFLWVALVCQELSDPKIKKRHTLQRLKSSYPPGLDPLYQRMMDNIRESPDADICQQILATTSLLYRPNTLAELSRLIESIDSFDDDDLIDLIGSCGSFLTIRDNVVYFIHQSAKDFLVNKASDKILASGIGYQHYTIFSRSLEILSETLRRDIYGLRLPGFPIEQVCSPDPDPLASIRYACIYWASHFGDSKHLQTPSVEKGRQGEDAISKLFEERYLYWLEALSLLHGMSEGVIAIDKLDNVQTPQLIELLKDAHRFILSYKPAIESAPLQVYASALIFCPSQSKWKKFFVAEEPNWILTKPLVETHWPPWLYTVEEHTGNVQSIAFSSNSALIALGSDKEIRRWSTKTGDCIRAPLMGHNDIIFSVAFSHDSTLLASGSKDTTVRLWRINTGDCLHVLKGHTKTIHLVAFSFDSKLVVSASGDRSIRLWQTSTGDCIQVKGHKRHILAIAFSQNSALLASFDGTIRLWSTDTGHFVRKLRINSTTKQCAAAFSQDLTLLGLALNDNPIQFWRTDTGECVRESNGYFSESHSIAFSYHSDFIASVSTDGIFRLWRTDTGDLVRELRTPEAIKYAAFSHDLNIIAAPIGNFVFRVWSTDDTDSYMQEQKGSRYGITSIIFSQCSTLVASASIWESIVSLWCAKTGRHLHELRGHQKGVDSIAFSHDSALLASADFYEETIRLWRTDTGECVRVINGPSMTSKIAFSHDSALLASASWASASCTDAIQLWRTDTGGCVKTLPVKTKHTGEITSIAFSHDSALIATGLAKGAVRINNVTTGNLVLIPAPSLGPGFSRDQRWITWNNNNVLWIPENEKRQPPWAISESTVAVGCMSGRFFIIGFSDEELSKIYAGVNYA
ncbi:uncharacterized protein TRIVIDRAFT_160506 [Trichoderma virens Gv29-8]|uniref:NACHT domain-containing protein n=1 Tax=Hypocrea virens (strain Gv29-8 / FGSC 10586) TaxID=413071 RepID=G9N6C4_HYPVG|nr:uncharacterized protein TRIVIDRAFT_160506 [Trichoderma virens Gv29-8]EHK17686.1 hypothetical protein TRIVIDRAFT_160506 [Trichoderma virens Gv29-8]